MAELTLYHFDGCPFCQKVRDYLTAQNITVTLKDIREDPANKEELLKIGGKSQVPCLVIDGKPLYESEAIIEWLAQNSPQ